MTTILPSLMAIGIVLVDYVIKVSGNYSNRSPSRQVITVPSFGGHRHYRSKDVMVLFWRAI